MDRGVYYVKSYLEILSTAQFFHSQIGLFLEGKSIIHTIEYRDKTYAICREGKFGTIEINESGRLNLVNEMPNYFDPFHPPMLFVR